MRSFKIKASAGKPTKKKFSIKASGGQFADDINAENSKRILKALYDAIYDEYDGKVINGVELSVHDKWTLKNPGTAKFDITFLAPDYNNDTMLEVISDPKLGAKFLCRVSVEPFKYDEQFEIKQTGAKQTIINKINEITSRLSEGVTAACDGVKASVLKKRQQAVRAGWGYEESYDNNYVDETPAELKAQFDKDNELKDHLWDNWFYAFERLHPNDDYKSYAEYPDVDAEVGYTREDIEYHANRIKAATKITKKSVKASSSAKKRKAIKAGRSKLISKDKWTVDTASRYSLHNSRTGDIENSNNKASLIRKCKNLTDPAWVEDNMLGGIIFNNKAQNQADFEAIDPPFIFPVESATSHRTVKASHSAKKRKAIKASDADGIADEWEDIKELSVAPYNYNGYDDGDLLEDVDQYFRRFDDIWLNADFVSYNGPDDWSVDASLSSDGVGSDFNYFLEDNFPDLYETLNTSYTTEPDDYHDSYSYDLLDILVPNDFSIQFYPGNRQFSAPQIDFDTEDRQLKAQLEEARSAYEADRIAAYKNLQNGLGDYLASGITASTNIECAKSLDLNARNNWDEWVLYGYDINGADVDTRVIDFQDNVRDAVGELFAWPEVDTVDLYKRGPADYDGEYFNTITRADYEAGNIEASTDITAGIDIGKKHDYSNPIYDLSGYIRMLSDEVQNLISDDISVTVTDEAITFTQNGEVVYIQPTEEIIPEPDDLESDAEELATAVGSVLYDKAMREDFDRAWDATYDEDYATRAVEFSTDTDDLEPITGTASAEDRIFDIITDKLRSSELAEFGDVDLLNGEADIKIHSNGADLDYIIAFVGDPTTLDFENRFMKYVKNPNYNDLNADSITNLATEIVVEDGMIKSVNFVNLDDNDLTNYDITAYEDFIRKMAEPTVSEIYTFIDEAVSDGSI